MVTNKFPVDAIWIDANHADGYRWFKWNYTAYSDPLEMQKNIANHNKVCVVASNPHIKVDKDYSVYSGAQGKYFLQWSNGTDYQGNCIYSASKNGQLVEIDKFTTN